jgi:hypothetical protein
VAVRDKGVRVGRLWGGLVVYTLALWTVYPV